eukprot:TRINITY_DN1450_c0_g2_i1.p1 TRINITY_DN1450_c0_g2~~TRINITY_DN1450_c0_g2_i1.p1  ORF type:complete len:776 (+),score=232.52 TRINITY_DN1450_c0_g2_i1:919-3246(+)
MKGEKQQGTKPPAKQLISPTMSTQPVKASPHKEKEEKTKPSSKKPHIEISTETHAITPVTKEEPEKPKPKRPWMSWNRSTAALNHGCKPIPEGAEGCLGGKVFCITGVLESLDREEAHELIEKYGGLFVKTLAKKTTHLIMGSEAGETKQEKAKEVGAQVISEDDLLEMIKTLPPQKIVLKKPKAKKTKVEEEIIDEPSLPILSKPPMRAPPASASQLPVSTSSPSIPVSSETPTFKVPTKVEEINQLWVDKYKPKIPSELIGNVDIVKKLSEYVQSWQLSTSERKHNAVLLSGPPGIGKTTMTHMIAKQKGFHVIEFNASDTRSKVSLKEHVAEITGTKSINQFFSTIKEDKEEKPSKVLLVMDEVDGMSSGDRGGMNELLQIIKGTKVPIVCICNDRSNQKLKSLAGYCSDLRCKKPSTIEITNRLEKICSMEKFPISRQSLEKISISVDGDMRQALHLLQMLHLGKIDSLQKTLDTALKDVEIGAFDLIPKLFSFIGTNLETKMRYYFADYQMVPLLVQENYPHVRPRPTPGVNSALDQLQKFALAADSISISDVVDSKLRAGRWELMNEHAMTSTVIPAFYVQGQMTQSFANFPTFLGKYSTSSKNRRLCQGLQVTSRTSTLTSQDQLAMECMGLFKQKLTQPLIQQGQSGIDEVISFMDEYNFCRDDWDSVMSLNEYSTGQAPKPETEAKIPSAVLSSFTKKFNSLHQLVSQAKTVQAASKSTKYSQPLEAEEFTESSTVAEEEEESESTLDFIKEKKGKQKPKTVKAKK